MSEEEYYSRLKKLEGRLLTDRTCDDENYYIECQKNYLSKRYIETIEKENERLHSIIKEVREYIEELAEDTEDYIGAIDRRRKVELLEILDKVGEE